VFVFLCVCVFVVVSLIDKGIVVGALVRRFKQNGASVSIKRRRRCRLVQA